MDAELATILSLSRFSNFFTFDDSGPVTPVTQSPVSCDTDDIYATCQNIYKVPVPNMNPKHVIQKGNSHRNNLENQQRNGNPRKDIIFHQLALKARKKGGDMGG